MIVVNEFMRRILARQLNIFSLAENMCVELTILDYFLGIP